MSGPRIIGNGIAIVGMGPGDDSRDGRWAAHVIDQPSIRVEFEADADAHNAYLLSVARVHLAGLGWSEVAR